MCVGDRTVVCYGDVVHVNSRIDWCKSATFISSTHLVDNVFKIFDFFVCSPLRGCFIDGFEKTYFFIPYRWFVIERVTNVNDFLCWVSIEAICYVKEQVGDDHVVF